LFALPAFPAAAERVPFDSEHWEFAAREHRVGEHLGREALFLRTGTARVRGAELRNGTVEFDIAVSGERGFVGGFWRMQGPGEMEELYLRPHQSGNPDALQYTPIFNGLSGWQLYHGDGYGAAVDFETDRWMHVKIVFAGGRGEVYVIDMERPAVVIHDLKREVAAGGVGLTAVGRFAPAWFSNFEYREEEAPMLRGPFRDLEPPAPGTVVAWHVSSPFGEASLEGATSLDDALAAREWSCVEAEESGTVNLARVARNAPSSDTVLARATLRSQGEQLKRLDFGYSDRVRVYLNGRLLYAGSNDYRSRDYRYLGTIGWFDALLLPLRDGANTVTFAVSESFGGWGVRARLADPGGVSLEPGCAADAVEAAETAGN
jgi:hypothetical protein